MKRLQLPLNVNPPLVIYQYRAYPLSITSNYPATDTWFHSNFIHLKCNLNFIEDQVDMNIDFIAGNIYGGIPWLDYQDFEIADYADKGSYEICNKIMSILDSGFYIYTFVDEYYIPERIPYHKYNLTHDILIFGYDMNNKTFKVIGFNDKRDYTESEVSFENLLYALRHSERNYTKLIRMREGYQYSFDKNNVIDKLEDYLFSRNCYGSLPRYDFDNRTEHMAHLDHFLLTENWSYGLEIYKQLERFNEALSENKINFDIRPFHCLWEHKKCMLERLKYFYHNKLIYDMGLIDSYEHLADKINAARLSMIKYFYSKDKRVLTRINTINNEVCEQEQRILSKVIEQLQKS